MNAGILAIAIYISIIVVIAILISKMVQRQSDSEVQGLGSEPHPTQSTVHPAADGAATRRVTLSSRIVRWSLLVAIAAALLAYWVVAAAPDLAAIIMSVRGGGTSHSPS